MPRGPVSKNKQFPELVASQFNSPEIVFQRWPPSLQLIKPQAYLSEVLWAGLRWNMWKHDRKPLFPLPNIRLSCFSLQPILSNSGISLFVTKMTIGFMTDISAIFHWWGRQLRSSKYASNGTRRVYRSASVQKVKARNIMNQTSIFVNWFMCISVYPQKGFVSRRNICATLCVCPRSNASPSTSSKFCPNVKLTTLGGPQFPSKPNGICRWPTKEYSLVFVRGIPCNSPYI
jgi:hypothetical protein